MKRLLLTAAIVLAGCESTPERDPAADVIEELARGPYLYSATHEIDLDVGPPVISIYANGKAIGWLQEDPTRITLWAPVCVRALGGTWIQYVGPVDCGDGD